MERRTFLLGAGLVSMGARAANDKVGIGVVGLGGRGRDHLKYYSKLPEARVVAICDVNQAQTERAVQVAEKLQGSQPHVHQDLRKLFEDKDVDAVSIATPNHWHALATIWACQAGKDVYCEKPACYNLFEGRAMEAAARKYKRIVQIGMQGRTITHKQRAMDLLHSGAIGQVYMARGICFKRRPSIGHTPTEPVPAGLDWDLFLGPAPMREYTKNRYQYNWHWFWDTGNGDIGNQGIHEMDLARRGLGRDLPKGVVSTGGKYVYEDDQETPNTQIATFDYGDAELVFEVRGLNTGGDAGIPASGPNFIGVTFFGSKGFMAVDEHGFQIFLGDKREPGESMKHAEGEIDDTIPHMANFLKAVKSRNPADLNADVSVGVTSAALVHMANISYRVGRKLTYDSASGSFTGDAQANAMSTRPVYRSPYVVT
ncbi:MAG TPA: Gfo/Idh/MocA family oxidoreductase [Bryobacteraceae bacterium]|nr:Gfo/Idh/MocA family oxidoreductase [Bryobacteraceae bacterium]